MLPSIGTDVLLDGKTVVHVQDRDNINQVAQVGEPDENDLIWNPQWVEWTRLSPIPNDTD